MTNTEFPADQGKDRDYIALERKVADLANALASGGSRFVTGDLIPHWTNTREGAVLCDGTIYLDTDPLVGDALAAMLRAGGFFTDATHVQVPDYTGRVLGGVGGSLGALGAPVGVATVTLTAAESGLPAHNTGAGTSHNHGGGVTGGPSVASTGTESANHTHTSTAAQENAGVLAGPGGGFNMSFNQSVVSSAQSANHTHSMQAHTHTITAEASHTHPVTAAAASSAHTNIQPSLPAYIFIKT